MIAVIIFIIEISATVAGQLLLKRAADRSRMYGLRKPAVLKLFAAGVLSLTVAFFLTVGLLQHFDLSLFYPVQGLSVVIITIAAVVVLRERLSAQLLVGSLLISCGIVVVSLS